MAGLRNHPVAVALLLGAAMAASQAAETPPPEWTKAEIVIRPGNPNTQGYAATLFHRQAYVVDVTDKPSGGGSVSQIWFSTNPGGRWVRTLVAEVPDDPGQGGVETPQITVIPASGHVVIAARANAASGSRLLSFSNQTGNWQPLALPTTETGGLAIHDLQAPALAAHGDTATLAFNANYDPNNPAGCSQQEGNVFLSVLKDGASAWPSAQNMTQDFCAAGLFAVGPVLTYSPSGSLTLLYERSGDPNALTQLALRSGTLAAGTEEIIEPAPAADNWGLISHSPYGFESLAFDAQGGAHVAYVTSDGGSATPPRLMVATQSPAGWQRTVLHQATKRWGDSDVATATTAIAAGTSGIAVAFVGSANSPLGGRDAQAVYLIHSTPDGWSPPQNFTRSPSTDNGPVLAASAGLLHLFMARDGTNYLYARQLPHPQIDAALKPGGGGAAAFTAGEPVLFAGTIAPATTPETVRVCLQRELSAGHWGKCQEEGVRTEIQKETGQFAYRHGPLPDGQYRLQAGVPETNDHLSGTGPWLDFTIR